MFVVDENTNAITLIKGDTGSIDITATMEDPEDPESGYEWAEDDRAVWTVRNATTGAVVFERYYPIVNNGFVIVFGNADTDTLPAGQYRWDLRFVVNPVWENDRIVNGDIVTTPGAYPLTLIDPVGVV